ncbi:MAG: sulfatase [Armatimonadetes bacterium]|nr:sulfatase [Armatimonadota bacterium]
MSDERPNLIVVVSDTLRTAYLGCYGNPNIRTPNLDAFAAESAVFDSAYPESLPTIPVRRALHTGRRAYPFRDYRPIPWDIVYLPGWQPMADDESTLAEDLARAGYHTGFATDTLPYFQPGLNFTRGFWQWEYLRGQQQDRWKSPAIVSDQRLSRFGDPAALRKQGPYNTVTRHAANTAHVRDAKDTSTWRTFDWGIQFIQENVSLQPFYLMLDCFDPHEPWEAPAAYYGIYADLDFSDKTIIHTHYGPAKGRYSDAQVRDIVAHYCGLVTLVDTCFGRLMTALDEAGLRENTCVAFISDHGTNFVSDNPEGIIGKPSYALYPGVMHLPFMVRFPDGAGRGRRFDQLVYNLDLVGTLYGMAGVEPSQPIDGQDLRTLVSGRDWRPRHYLTSRYGDTCWYRDETHWAIIDVHGTPRAIFDLRTDPGCMNNIAESAPEVAERAWARVLADGDGEMPVYVDGKRTDAIGGKE